MHDETARCNFDTESFIFEVQARPAIWDVNSEQYTDRDLKRKCWLDLSEMFIDKEGATKKDIVEFCRAIQRRWKSLRDCYTRECHKMMKRSESGSSNQRTYMYYRHLSFLSGVIKSKGVSSDTEDGSCGPSTVEAGLLDDEDEDGRSGPESPVTSATPVQSLALTDSRKRKRPDRHFEEDEETLVYCVMKPRKKKDENEAEDSDKLFLMSLLDPIKEIPERSRFTLRMEIMKVIDNFRNKAKT